MPKYHGRTGQSPVVVREKFRQLGESGEYMRKQPGKNNCVRPVTAELIVGKPKMPQAFSCFPPPDGSKNFNALNG